MGAMISNEKLQFLEKESLLKKLGCWAFFIEILLNEQPVMKNVTYPLSTHTSKE